jgi:hypothetical protein
MRGGADAFVQPVGRANPRQYRSMNNPQISDLFARRLRASRPRRGEKRKSADEAGFRHLAPAPALDHLLDQPGFTFELAAIMGARGVYDFAAASEERVTEFEDAQIGPGARTSADDRDQRLLSRSVWTRLRQDQCRCRGRARYAGMAVDQQMRVPSLCQFSPEREQALDILRLRRDPAGLRIDDVVKAQLKALMRIECIKGVGVRPARIEDRQDMSNAPLTMEAELVDPANRQLKRRQPPGEQSHPLPVF